MIPAGPEIAMAGKNTAIKAKAVAMIGDSNSAIASFAAFFGSAPASIFAEIASTTMIASSTTNPVARLNPINVKLSIANEKRFVNATAPKIETGSAINGINVDRQSW
jgi:hypothetical protein